MTNLGKKIRAALNVVRKFTNTYDAFSDIDFQNPVAGIHDPSKLSSHFDVDLPKVPRDAVKNLYSLSGEFASGSDIIEKAASMMRNALDSSQGLENTARSLMGFNANFHKIVQTFNDNDPMTNYTNRLTSKITEYGEMIDKVTEIIENQNNGTGLSINTDSMNELVGSLGGVFKDYRRAMDIVAAGSLNRNHQISAEDEKTLSMLEMGLDRKLGVVQTTVYKASQLASLEGAFQAELRKRLDANFDASDHFSDTLIDIGNSMKARDYRGAIWAFMKGLKQVNKATVKQGDGRAEFFKAMGGLMTPVAALGFLSVGAQIFKQVVGYLFGINNIAAEFNEKLVDAHGLASTMPSITTTLNYDPTAAFNGARSFFQKFGWQTKTFLAPEELFKMTGAYEKMGIKLDTMLQNQEETSGLLMTTLNYSVKTGMSIDELSGLQAGWKRDLGMDLKLMNAVLDTAAHGMENTGIPAKMYLDAAQNSEYDLDLWGESLISLIKLQENIIGKKNVNVKAGQDAFQAFTKHVNSFTAANWAVLLQKLPANAISDILAKDEARLQKKLASASTDTERTRVEVALKRIANARNSGDITNSYLLFPEVASLEAKAEIMKKAVTAEFGSGFFDRVKGGVLSLSEDQRLRKLLQFAGSEMDWEKMKISIISLMDPQFDVESLAKRITAAKDAVNLDKVRQLGKEAANAFLQSATSEEIWASIVNNYMADIINVMENILGYVRKWWQWIAKGSGKEGDPEAAKGAQAVIFHILDELKKAKTPEKKAQLMESLAKQSNVFMDAGGDPREIKAKAKELGVDKDVSSKLDELLVVREAQSGDGIGGNLKLSANWEKKIKQQNPKDADRIIAALNAGAQKYGEPADIFAGKLMQESGFNTSGITSGVGAMGIAQFMPGTAPEYGLSTKDALYGVEKPILAAFEYRRRNWKIIQDLCPETKQWSKKDQNRAILASYNMGAGGFHNNFKQAKASLGHAPSGWDQMTRAANMNAETFGYIPAIEANYKQYGGGGDSSSRAPDVPKTDTPKIPAPSPSSKIPSKVSNDKKHASLSPKQTSMQQKLASNSTNLLRDLNYSLRKI